jgi:hypothetical protein
VRRKQKSGAVSRRVSRNSGGRVGIQYRFYTAPAHLQQQIYAGWIYRSSMNSLILRARRMSLALVVVAVVDHGHLQTDYSGASPSTSGLMRLGRDLMRLASASAQGRERHLLR